MKTFFVSILLFLLLFVPGAEIARAARTVPMNDPAILYSPYNWDVTSSHAKTINAGAYLKVIFSGTSCRLTAETNGDAAPFSEFWARIDGGPFQKYTLAAGNPTFTVADGLADRSHLLEVVIKSTSETIDRWNSQATAVVFTGVVLDTGASVRLPVRKPYNILIYGDSITEGVRTAGYAGIPNDTDRNDAAQDYSWLLSQSLPAEVGVVGFGATGLTRGGSGAVPALPQSYKFLWAGQPRSFLPVPDLVLYNEGTNDRSSITADFLTVIRGIQAAAPNCKQMLLLPFNGSRASELKATVAQAASRNVAFGDTTGFWNSADASDGLHPYDYAHIGFIAPKVAALAAPLLSAPKKP
ncbi:MAG: GDSL-type esterase/lipase family protein [Janthinobacterium lividum]